MITPITRTCPACDGTGGAWVADRLGLDHGSEDRWDECPECNGEGTVDDYDEVELDQEAL